MALPHCSGCGGAIAEKTTRCPMCGVEDPIDEPDLATELKAGFKLAIWTIVIFGVAILLAVLSQRLLT